MDFSAPGAALGIGMFRDTADDLNGGFERVTPPPATTGVPFPAPTSAGELNSGGFLSPGFAAQNIITDPNQMGLMTPGGTTYGPDSLADPLSGAYYGAATGLYNAPGYSSRGGDSGSEY